MVFLFTKNKLLPSFFLLLSRSLTDRISDQFIEFFSDLLHQEIVSGVNKFILFNDCIKIKCKYFYFNQRVFIKESADARHQLKLKIGFYCFIKKHHPTVNQVYYQTPKSYVQWTILHFLQFILISFLMLGQRQFLSYMGNVKYFEKYNFLVKMRIKFTLNLLYTCKCNYETLTRQWLYSLGTETKLKGFVKQLTNLIENNIK